MQSYANTMVPLSTLRGYGMAPLGANTYGGQILEPVQVPASTSDAHAAKEVLRYASQPDEIPTPRKKRHFPRPRRNKTPERKEGGS